MHQMKIYVSDARNNASLIRAAINLNCGHMVTPKYLRKKQPVFWALDNGAFINYKKGTPFDIELYLNAVDKSLKFPTLPDFTVLPDIVAGGIESLNFSAKFLNKIKGVQRYLAVQDGMTVKDVEPYMKSIDGLFIGGTVPWKYKSMPVWVWLAHKYNKKCHVGRIGTLSGYQYCYNHHVDSVDGSNPTRNNRMVEIQYFYDWLSSNRQPRKF